MYSIGNGVFVFHTGRMRKHEYDEMKEDLLDIPFVTAVRDVPLSHLTAIVTNDTYTLEDVKAEMEKMEKKKTMTSNTANPVEHHLELVGTQGIINEPVTHEHMSTAQRKIYGNVDDVWMHTHHGESIAVDVDDDGNDVFMQAANYQGNLNITRYADGIGTMMGSLSCAFFQTNNMYPSHSNPYTEARLRAGHRVQLANDSGVLIALMGDRVKEG